MLINTSATNEKGRNTLMAFLTVFTTILVVLGHCDMTPDYKKTWIFRWIYSFHMPLFFFISGFLFCLTNPPKRIVSTKYSSFTKKKFIRLIIPFIVIDSTIFIIKATLFSESEIIQHPIELTIQSYYHHLLIQPIGFMWFLPTLFLIFIFVFPLWKYIKSHHSLKAILVTSIIIYSLSFVASIDKDAIRFLQFSRSIFYLAFFWTGILYCEFSSIIDRFLSKYWIIVFFISGVISIFFIGNSIVRTSAGILLSIIIGLLISDKTPSWILNCTAFTYTIYLLSYFPQMLVKGPIYHSFPYINQYWFSALSFILGLSVPIIFCVIYNKIQNKYHPLRKYSFIFGF